MTNKLNLNKLKEEIDSRKKEKSVDTSSINEGNNTQNPKDVFLNGLLVSLNTGKDTESTNLIKNVDNSTSLKLNESPKMKVSDNVNTQQKPIPKQSQGGMLPERDELMWSKFQNMNEQTLSEQLTQYSQLKQSHVGHNQPQQQSQLNEETLIKGVKGAVDKYLTENFGTVIEDTMKSVIIEMYAAEKIKEVLTENRNLIKSVVIETIREIQAKNKANKK